MTERWQQRFGKAKRAAKAAGRGTWKATKYVGEIALPIIIAAVISEVLERGKAKL
jgi:hypothetical protein